jgi:hypothetical protein
MNVRGIEDGSMSQTEIWDHIPCGSTLRAAGEKSMPGNFKIDSLLLSNGI